MLDALIHLNETHTVEIEMLNQATWPNVFLPLLISFMLLMLVPEAVFASENISFKNIRLIHSWGNPELGVISKYAPNIEFRVSNTSSVIFDARLRSRYLNENPRIMKKYCGGRSSYNPAFKLDMKAGIKKLTEEQMHGSQTDRPDSYKDQQKVFESTANRFMFLISDCLVGNNTSCKQIHQDILMYVEANAPEVPDPDNNGYEYSLNSYVTHTRLARPSLIAFSVQKALLSEGASNQDKEILEWFRSLIIRSEERLPLSSKYPNFDVPTQGNNHFLNSSLVFMMYGVLAEDDSFFRRGVEQYFVTLSTARKDGSLPLETRRGNASIAYMSHTLNALMLTAEIAKNQGYDLYSMAAGDTTIHDVVAYLLSAYKNIDAITPYAKEDHAGQDEGKWMDQNLRFDPRGWFLWADLYVNRFPNHANTQNLLDLIIDDRIVCKPFQWGPWKGEGGCSSKGTRLIDLIKDATSLDVAGPAACFFRTKESPLDGIYEINTSLTVKSDDIEVEKDWIWWKLRVDNLSTKQGKLISFELPIFVNLYQSSKDNPFDIEIWLRKDFFPSIDVANMKTCGRKIARAKNGKEELRLSVLFGPKTQASRCAYKLLSKEDQEAVQTVFEEFETIINLAIKDKKEISYWKDIASKVANNTENLID